MATSLSHSASTTAVSDAHDKVFDVARGPDCQCAMRCGNGYDRGPHGGEVPRFEKLYESLENKNNTIMAKQAISNYYSFDKNVSASLVSWFERQRRF